VVRTEQEVRTDAVLKGLILTYEQFGLMSKYNFFSPVINDTFLSIKDVI